jgi:pimeloyl-ACP methyl ester carboxylesterase
MLLLLECRAAFELAALPVTLPFLSRLVPQGDGHPVAVLPGLLSSDMSTQPLRQFLRWRGYDAHGWGQGRNMGMREGAMDRVQETLFQLHRRTERKLSLIGWSLGGIFAREFARVLPQAVRQVILLGSPLHGAPERITNVWEIYRWASGHSDVKPHERGDEPPPVPTTSIFTRADGIVSWRSCVEHPTPLSDNIEVSFASHVGLGFNPIVYYVIGDRLAQPEDRWKPFRPRGFARAWFPSLSSAL